MSSVPPPTPPAPELPAGLPEPALAAEAMALVLAPLARLMIDHGLQLPDLVEQLKRALVEQAHNSFGLAEKGSSDTRIALLTGVHRKDVKRLRAAQVSSLDAAVPLAAAVVARWISEPRYLNADHSPRALARTPKRVNAGDPDFTTLVAEVSRDVGARAVLDELERLRVVELLDEGYVALKAAAFVPQVGNRESFHFLAANVSDHLATAVHNLAPARVQAPMLEQSAFSAVLSAAQAEELHQMARKLWSAALPQFLQMATVAEQRSQDDLGPKHRIRFGVYFHDALQKMPVDGAPNAEPPRKKTRKPRS